MIYGSIKVTQMPPVHAVNLVANSYNTAYGVEVIGGGVCHRLKGMMECLFREYEAWWDVCSESVRHGGMYVQRGIVGCMFREALWDVCSESMGCMFREYEAWWDVQSMRHGGMYVQRVWGTRCMWQCSGDGIVGCLFNVLRVWWDAWCSFPGIGGIVGFLLQCSWDWGHSGIRVQGVGGIVGFLLQHSGDGIVGCMLHCSGNEGCGKLQSAWGWGMNGCVWQGNWDLWCGMHL